MSFGKRFGSHKQVVDEAVAYAEKKGVLLVHAAGNSSEDNDTAPNFPNARLFQKGGKQRLATNWIEVGASSKRGRPANFSNFGQKSVHVFAPGVGINSTAPGNNYKRADGTSMASPVTAGVAALLKSYYPTLLPLQMRSILIETVVKQKSLTRKSISGGIVNALNAMESLDEFFQQQQQESLLGAL